MTAATFHYRARDAAGTERRGELAGASPRAVARELSARGLVVLEVRAGSGRAAAPAAGPAAAAASGAAAARPASLAELSAWWARRSALKSKEIQQSQGLVMRELSALLRAGVPLMRALKLAADSSAQAPIRESLERLQHDLDNGLSLVAAAEKEHRHSGLISAYDVAMLQIGEQTGRLPEAFSELHRHREFIASTREQVVSALRYPMFVIATCLLAVVVVNLFVIPSFAKVFAQARAELPILTQFLMAFSNAMQRGWPLILVAVVGGSIAWGRWTASPRGALWWDRVKLRLPVVGPILHGVVLARLATSFASAASAGLTISDALAVTARTLENRWYESRVNQMCTELARGVSITASARNMGILPPTMLQLFAIGEESGSLDDLMREIAVHYQAEVEYAIRRLSATLEPILIWFLGIGVLVLALGVFMPMWDLGRASLH